MPWKPQSPCPTPGCASLTSGGPCARCLRAKWQRYDQTRPSASRRGYGLKRWTVLRAQKLATNPWCETCLAGHIYEPAREVDHVQAHDGPDDPLFWLWENLRALCKVCHSRKTATVDSNFAQTRKAAI